MASLGDITKIERNIKNSALPAVRALHVIAFGEEGQARRVRRNLRGFTGFGLNENSDEFNQKVSSVLSAVDYPNLITVCHILNLDYTGEIKDVGRRICLFLNKPYDDKDEREENEDEEDQPKDDEESISEDEYEDEEVEIRSQRSLGSTTGQHRRRGQQRSVYADKSFALTFRDIEDSIRSFDGKDGYPIEKWIEEFEEIAQLTGWNELQKLIFAKKSLSGTAKLYIQSERGITSWSILKRLLRKEFEVRVSSAQVHKTLMQKKKRKEESLQEYVLAMREIGNRASIEDEALIQYIIDGISDEPANKIILYGAKTFQEFKDKMKLYEIVRSKSQGQSQGYMSREKGHFNGPDRFKKEKVNKTENTKRDDNAVKKTPSTYHCYNCGAKGHTSKYCPSKQKGTKCFACNDYGHLAASCTKKNAGAGPSTGGAPERATVNSIIRNNMINVTIDGCKFSSLFDTGSDVNLVREDMFRSRLNSVHLAESPLLITGIGGKQIKTLGSFTSDTVIDDETFPLTFHIIPKDATNFEVIIGNPLLSQAEVLLTNDGIVVHQIQNQNFMMHVRLEDGNELDVNHIRDPIIKQSLEDVVRAYKPNKTETTGVEMKIVLTDDEPIYQSPRRLPQPEKLEVEKQVNEWLEDGIIRASSSDYASPIVLVRKKDDSYRMCIDYRKINKKIVKDRFPLPLIDDVLDKLQGAKVFSTIDLKNGFFHVSVEESSRKFTSFVTHHGQFEFCKVPFGLCNSPSVFQRYVYQVFRPLMNQSVAIVYMDDVVIPAKDEVEGLERLNLVLDTASKFGLEPKFKKCQFLKRQVTFLGHIIEEGTIRPSEEKTEAVRNFPVPTTIKQIQSFLGLTGYFRKYIPSYSLIARPLSDLLKAGSTFVFGIDQHQAFEKLKTALVTKPVLNIYRQDARTELHVDASKHGFGAALLQEGDDGKLHPVHFMSKKTTPAQQKLHSYHLEVLAITEALTKFRVYLLGNKFKIVTDCEAFKKTMEKKNLATRVARWALLLEEFDYEIEHRKGERMRHVDALSRIPAVMMIENVVLRRVQGAQQQDFNLKAIIKILENENYEDYLLENGVLYKEQDGEKLLVIPKSMQTEIIRTAHEPGHFGVKKTESLINKNYYIPKIRKKIEDYISSCIPCIIGNRKQGRQEGLLNPIAKGNVPLDTYHLDHCGPFESTKKTYKYILLMIDAFSKFVWIFPTKTLSTKEVLDKLTLHQSTFGNPRRIITDKGGAFRAEDFKNYCEQQDIEHVQITTGVPRGNGQAENMVRIVTSALRRLACDDPPTWYKHVARLQIAINSTCNRSTSYSPFKVMFGVDMKVKENQDLMKILEEIGREVFEERRYELREDARQAIKKVQEENSKNYNKKRKIASTYQLGDIVAIRRTQFGTQNKLFPRFLGPYKVIKVKGRDRYDVERVGKGEGPKFTSTSADNIKFWKLASTDDDSSGSDEMQDGRAVGLDSK